MVVSHFLPDTAECALLSVWTPYMDSSLVVNTLSALSDKVLVCWNIITDLSSPSSFLPLLMIYNHK